jgi:hypothetical protein
VLLAACSTNTSVSTSSASAGAAAAAGAAPATAPADGEALVRQMHARYDGKWYRTLTFKQQTTFPAAANRSPETWYEAGSIPGKLRIDVMPLDSMNAFMYVGDSAYAFRHGTPMPARKDRNLLMTLGFDVYGQDPATTIAQLRESGMDLSKIHEITWQGRPVWVVGAAAGDSTTNQFWIEKDRLLFVRLIEVRKNPRDPQAPGVVLDAEFNKYQPFGRAWVAPECVIRVNGKDYQREEYSEIKVDVPLPESLYDTKEYHRPEWVGKQ